MSRNQCLVVIAFVLLVAAALIFVVRPTTETRTAAERATEIEPVAQATLDERPAQPDTTIEPAPPTTLMLDHVVIDRPTVPDWAIQHHELVCEVRRVQREAIERGGMDAWKEPVKDLLDKSDLVRSHRIDPDGSVLVCFKSHGEIELYAPMPREDPNGDHESKTWQGFMERLRK